MRLLAVAAAMSLALGLQSPNPSAARDRQTTVSSMPFANTPTAWAPPPVLELPGDTLEELPSHRAIVAGTTALAAAGAIHAATELGPIDAACLLVGAMVFADFLTGVFHWATDNYGNLETPLVGPACAAFQGHHRHPYTIVHRTFCNNVFKIAKIVAPLIAASAWLPPAPAYFLTVALYCQMLSQEFHKYSHMPPNRHPDLVRTLQRAGLIISTKEHGRHHTSPYDGHYCIFNGWCNSFLDQSKFFRRLEALIFTEFGVEPNCWKADERGEAVKRDALATLGGRKAEARDSTIM